MVFIGGVGARDGAGSVAHKRERYSLIAAENELFSCVAPMHQDDAADS
jgi:hypothetical protein